MSDAVRDALRVTGLLPVAQRTKLHLWKARQIYGADLRTLIRPESAPDGLPIPPARLRYYATGSTDVPAFLAGGRRVAETIEMTLARNGVRLSGLEAMLDFGVGCGRVARGWSTLTGVEVHGSDYNPALVAWCSRNLRFATFVTNALAPPLPYSDERFDLVYSYSVFTHLPEELGLSWIAELRRVLKPGGHAFVTTHGDAFAAGRLKGNELERYRRGEIIVRQRTLAGTNTCASFHPPAYVRETFGAGFEIVDSKPGAGPTPTDPGAIRQDVHLLRKVDA